MKEPKRTLSSTVYDVWFLADLARNALRAGRSARAKEYLERVRKLLEEKNKAAAK